MKTYVMIVNSIMLILMASLAALQTGCTPITPSLDRRLFAKKDSQPVMTSDTASSTLQLTPFNKTPPITKKGKIFVSLKLNEDFVTDDDSELDDDQDTNLCKVNELEPEAIERFKKDRQIEITIPKSDTAKAEFDFEIALISKEIKAFTAKEVEYELEPTDVNDVWTLELTSNQDEKTVTTVEKSIRSIQWKVCTGAEIKNKITKASAKVL